VDDELEGAEVFTKGDDDSLMVSFCVAAVAALRFREFVVLVDIVLDGVAVAVPVEGRLPAPVP